MRKLLFFPLMVSLFALDFGAVAAGRATRGSAGANNNSNATAGAAPVAARAAVRGAKPAAMQNSGGAAPVAARAAARNTPKSMPAAASANTAKPSAGGAVAARAGAKQKVINMGTKVAAATTNTAVDVECQNAYFGCMDSFCMVDNVTGGRCRCSDKNAEYDTMLAKIMDADQQTYVMQTEGVAMLKMGKSADEVYSMAEEAAKKATGKGKKDDAKTTTKKKVDLTAWNNDLFSDDDVFEEEETVLDKDLMSKTGDALHARSASLCSAQMSDKCKSSVSMLKMIYVQKIQSDCAAYENTLKQQELESNQKLQTAKQTLRETALEKYNEKNKYDLGGCVREYSACMQQDETCGDNYSGCVTFAATENMKNSQKTGTVAKQTTIKGTSIKLAASTIDELSAKRVFCDSILEQCVNVKNQVWDAFLRGAAVTIATAESDAESKLRIGCVSEITQCFHEACKEKFDPNNQDGSYDSCLADPNLYKDLCKPKLEPCLLATGGTYETPGKSSLWTSILARLASMKVDACTKEVKDCLLSDDRCGKDYEGCIGLSTQDIGNLCPFQKLTACMTEKKDEATVRDYVAQIGSGLALNIDNNMLTHCQTALKTAMLTYCGAEDSCPNAKVDEGVFKGSMHVELCKVGSADCSSDPYYFDSNDLIMGQVSPRLTGKTDIAAMTYKVQEAQANAPKVADVKEIFEQSDGDQDATHGYSTNGLDRLKKTLNNAYMNMVRTVESDPKVQYCIAGRSNVQGFGNSKDEAALMISNTSGNGRFPNLTNNIRNAIAHGLLNSAYEPYFEEQENVYNSEMAPVMQKMTDRISEFVEMKQEEQKKYNAIACQEMQDVSSPGSIHGCGQNHHDVKAEYDEEKNECVLTQLHYKKNGCGAAYKWYLEEKDTKVKRYPMPSVSRASLREGEGVKENPLSDAEKENAVSFDNY